MDRDSILEQLRAERDRLARALEALEDASTIIGRSSITEGSRQHRLTPEGRRRLSQLMKKRWAERRKRKAGKTKRAQSTKHVTRARRKSAVAQPARGSKLQPRVQTTTSSKIPAKAVVATKNPPEQTGLSA